jgi:rRNA maturation protein Nop10
MNLKKCLKCKDYTLKTKCEKCNQETFSAHYKYKSHKKSEEIKEG